MKFKKDLSNITRNKVGKIHVSHQDGIKSTQDF